jgi:L-fuconolactonase
VNTPSVADGHLHVFRAVSERYPREVHALFPADLEASVEGLLERMHEAGVDRAVLVPLSPHDEYLRECLARYPATFAGVGVHDPTSADPAGDARRRHEDVGLQGLRVHHLGDPAVSDAEQLEAWPLLDAMAELDLVLWFYPPPEQLPVLPLVLDALPALRVMLNHLGFCPRGYEMDEHGRPRIRTELPPATLPSVLELARYPTVHVMFSGHYAFSQEAYPYADLRPVSERAYRAFGAARLMWASDYPWIAKEPGYPRMLELVEQQLPRLSPTERAEILGGTAERLFWS